MNWLSNASWLAGPLLQITLVVFMVRNKFHIEFPRFFSYILFQTLKSACLFVAFRYFADSYFEAYWTGNAVSVIFAVAVMDEILRSLFQEYGGTGSLGTTIFRWSCGLLMLLAIVGAWSSGEVGGDRIIATVFAFDRSTRLMQVGFFLLLLLLRRFFKDCWSQPVFGIALGFGVFASVELILLSMAMGFGHRHEATVSLLKSAAYNAVTLLWIGYLRKQPQPAPKLVPARSPNSLGMALATVGGMPEDPDARFMLRVEQAVDRVLSRSDWPRPNTKGRRFISRKPHSEECN